MAVVTKFDHSTKSLVHSQMRQIVSTISPYWWVIDAYVSDFYTKGFWNQLPVSQQEYFDVVEPTDLAWLLCCCDKATHQLKACCRQVSVLPPLSLLALRCCISSLALQRTATDPELPLFRETLLTALSKSDHLDNFKDIESCQVECKEKPLSTAAGPAPNFKNGQCMDMQHIFRKHVKPKKQHEINNLGQVVNVLSQATGTSAAVDVGAGLGHLARVLAFQHSLCVTTIEAAGSHAPKASEFDKDLRKNIHKVKMKKRKELAQSRDTYASKDSIQNSCDSSLDKGEAEGQGQIPVASINNHVEDPNIPNDIGTAVPSPHLDKRTENENNCDTEMPRHVICTVQPDIAASQFLDIMLSRHQSADGSSLVPGPNGDNTNFVLVSLHACGDLTPTLLRVFLNCPTARGIASVSCCYMKMTASPSSPTVELDNFPMSSYLGDLPFQCLSYEAREMACHFADAYHQRLLENPAHLKSHSYRAALEKLLQSVDPSFKSGQARIATKISPGLTFYQYATENLKKRDISIESVSSDLMEECAQLTSRWKRVVAFYTLRLSLAPLVETLLLFDRALFLLENGVPSLLVPIFDPNISPRNFTLLAVKP